MTVAETTDQLAAVSLNGRPLSFSHGVLIHALRTWHIALYQVPSYACPVVRKDGRVVLETTAGDRLTGDVVTEFVTDHGEYVLLTGTGRLKLEPPARAA
jgi:hypothetical protein